MISIDLECCDPNLKTLGDGSIRKDGRILCIGMYDGTNSYIFDDYTSDNEQQRMVDILASNETKVFHNGLYDMSWITCYLGCKVNGKIEDTMTRAGLLDEYAPSISLDECCKAMGIEGKNKSDTIEIWAKARGISDVMKHLSELYEDPEGRKAVQRYCLQDCKATYDLFYAQQKMIDRWELQEVNDLESDLYPVLMLMKKNGCKIDTVYRDQLVGELAYSNEQHAKELEEAWGITTATIASPKKMTIAMHGLGIKSDILTEKGAESWSADALDRIDHPAAILITETKKEKTLIKSIDTHFREHLIGDRVHATFYPTQREDGGTRTGRFSSNHPNMQNVPARDSEFGARVRQIVIPDDGMVILAADYSQIEYMVASHFAVGKGSAEVKEAARAGVDFHSMAMKMTGIKERNLVKGFNFGVLYGMGLTAMRNGKNRRNFMKAADEACVPFMQYTQQIYDTYFEKMPWVKSTMSMIEQQTKINGYYRTFSGRIQHKPKPKWINGKLNDFIYKMTNSVVQGTAADIMKKAMIDSYKSGCFDELKLYLTVHDEIVAGVNYNTIGTQAAQEMQRCMSNAYSDRLSVPIRASVEAGPHWGYWHDDIWNNMCKGVFNVDRQNYK